MQQRPRTYFFPRYGRFRYCYCCLDKDLKGIAWIGQTTLWRVIWNSDELGLITSAKTYIRPWASWEAFSLSVWSFRPPPPSLYLRDCKRNFRWPSTPRQQCPIHNVTVKAWSSLNYIWMLMIVYFYLGFLYISDLRFSTAGSHIGIIRN